MADRICVAKLTKKNFSKQGVRVYKSDAYFWLHYHNYYWNFFRMIFVHILHSPFSPRRACFIVVFKSVKLQTSLDFCKYRSFPRALSHQLIFRVQLRLPKGARIRHIYTYIYIMCCFTHALRVAKSQVANAAQQKKTHLNFVKIWFTRAIPVIFELDAKFHTKNYVNKHLTQFKHRSTESSKHRAVPYRAVPCNAQLKHQ